MWLRSGRPKTTTDTDSDGRAKDKFLLRKGRRLSWRIARKRRPRRWHARALYQNVHGPVEDGDALGERPRGVVSLTSSGRLGKHFTTSLSPKMRGEHQDGIGPCVCRSHEGGSTTQVEPPPLGKGSPLAHEAGEDGIGFFDARHPRRHGGEPGGAPQ